MDYKLFLFCQQINSYLAKSLLFAKTVGVYFFKSGVVLIYWKLGEGEVGEI